MVERGRARRRGALLLVSLVIAGVAVAPYGLGAGADAGLWRVSAVGMSG